MAIRAGRQAMALLVVSLCVSNVQASELSARLTLTTEYIYRGLQRSDGDPAFQLGLDYEHGSGLFAGLWGSTVDIRTPSSERDLEVDYYAGYHHQFAEDFSTAVTVLRYTYPGTSGGVSARDYDYTEFLASATWRQRYSIEMGYTDDWSGLGTTSRHWEVQGEYPIFDSWLMTATLGRHDLSNVGASNYLYWDVGASARFSRLIVDLRWFDNENPGGFIANASAGSQIVLSLSLAL